MTTFAIFHCDISAPISFFAAAGLAEPLVLAEAIADWDRAVGRADAQISSYDISRRRRYVFCQFDTKAAARMRPGHFHGAAIIDTWCCLTA